MIHINIVNKSSVVNDTDGWNAVQAVAAQINRDFFPAWGIDAKLYYSGIGKPLATGPGVWELIILDDSDQQGALGYHETTSQGLPIGYVFAKTTINAGLSWTVTLSHECLEMLSDPDINLTCFVESGNGGTLFALENCDAVEEDSLGYTIAVPQPPDSAGNPVPPVNVLVSDFVFPSWFQSFQPAGTQFDYMKKITAPFQLLPGGYIGQYQVPGGNGWTQLTADRSPKTLKAAKPHIGSRRDRRRTPRSDWQRSTAPA
jgi:hypothetical protein